jgi:polyisoprenyl-phosphate glycosyltransferase
MPEHDRFMGGMVAWAGFQQIAVPYRRAARFAGESKYPLLAMIRFALDGLTSFSRAPLRFATWMGVLMSTVAVAAVLYVLVLTLFTDTSITGWTALLVTLLVLGGAQPLSLGIVGEYIGRIYGESKRRPLYLLEEARGFEHGFIHSTQDVSRSAMTVRRRADDAPRRAN